ncbi:hypothetical protein CEUSTIGMA_g11511.t1 [Chlamydomonas eustigma]|uniref:Uncharacterized protein n=1 Tax=Chlamydomonas eustigma TaxID=1157962 RepID=A0A250XLZ3_9CHLO|nr:hypothetical protein CEUSTIGMA_g11511.t1 [Chlamydomonas eustigma]|eukprot:GAX84087.1 hypothetical protein CEUSTIGMA_g11511.t1 [Chlamydomonas eustigma]
MRRVIPLEQLACQDLSIRRWIKASDHEGYVVTFRMLYAHLALFTTLTWLLLAFREKYLNCEVLHQSCKRDRFSILAKKALALSSKTTVTAAAACYYTAAGHSLRIRNKCMM